MFAPQVRSMAAGAEGGRQVWATAEFTFFNASSTRERTAAGREEHNDGRTQTIAFAAPTASPTPEADEAKAMMSFLAGSHVVSAPPVCTPLPAQLTMPGFGEEAERGGEEAERDGEEAVVRACKDDSPLEVKLAYKQNGSFELAFIVLPPDLPDHGLSIVTARWYPSASRKDAPTGRGEEEEEEEERGADIRLQHRGVCWKCMKCVHDLCRDTCCWSQGACLLSCCMLGVFVIIVIQIVESSGGG